MRVLLTGANGWIGSVIARDLLDAGHFVIGLVRSEEKARALEPGIPEPPPRLATGAKSAGTISSITRYSASGRAT